MYNLRSHICLHCIFRNQMKDFYHEIWFESSGAHIFITDVFITNLILMHTEQDDNFITQCNVFLFLEMILLSNYWSGQLFPLNMSFHFPTLDQNSVNACFIKMKYQWISLKVDNLSFAKTLKWHSFQYSPYFD